MALASIPDCSLGLCIVAFNYFRSLASLSYPLARACLFRMDAERAHHLTLRALAMIQDTAMMHFGPSTFAPGQPVEVMGLRFPNRLGLAAGLDKAATCVDGFGGLGFGHVEVGTLTPRPQPGNPQPRLFRLKGSEAIINRMGFNNPGIEDAAARLAKRVFPGVLGVNVGKNFDTPNEEAVSDYVKGLRCAYAVADYVAINLSSPNTKALRELQLVSLCEPLLTTLQRERDALCESTGRYVPLAVKIAPDLELEDLQQMAAMFNRLRVDGVIATNTTISRKEVLNEALHKEAGGLSGKPLAARSTEVIATLRKQLDSSIPIIGVGGIDSGAEAVAKLQAGADLVQVYTGFIYRGPELIESVLQAIDQSPSISAV